jgi:hypothetical protein
LRKRDEVDVNSAPPGQNKAPSAAVPSTSKGQESVITRRSWRGSKRDEYRWETECEEIDAFFAKTSTRRDGELKNADDVRDLSVGVLRDMYVTYNTRVPAGAVSRHIISVCNRAIRDARIQPGEYHSKLVFLRTNWQLVSYLKKKV